MLGLKDAGRGRGSGTGVHARTAALVVLAAFGLGIGPGTAVQPCPKHAMAGPESATEDARHVAGRAHDHGGAHSNDQSRTSHSDGPCDCLGLCHGCCAPEARFAGARVLPPGTLFSRFAAEPVQLVARHPARHLRPFAQPPPT